LYQNLALNRTLRFTLLVLLSGLPLFTYSQTTAITSEGRKIILSSDGTWKYDLKDTVIVKFWSLDSTAVQSVTTVMDSATNQAHVEVVVTPPPPPPKPKLPPDLSCPALVDVTVTIQGDKWASVSRKITVEDEATKKGYSLSMYKSRNGPLIWTTKLLGPGQCIGADSKMFMVFKDGSVKQIENNGTENCDGNFILYFGGDYGNDNTLEIIRSKEIASLRVTTKQGYVEGNIPDDDSARFMAATNCMYNIPAAPKK
jgi:hypothetical protein